jgi:hypothetical protein
MHISDFPRKNSFFFGFLPAFFVYSMFIWAALQMMKGKPPLYAGNIRRTVF